MATRISKSNKKVGRKSAAARAGVAELTPKEIKALQGAPERFARNPDVSVAQLLAEARDLIAATRPPARAAKLVDGSRLEAGFSQRLDAARDVLDRAESMWSVRNASSLTRSLKQARAAAETLKKNALTSLRYFVPDDEDLHDDLDEIAVGTGDPDTIADLRKLAPLAAAHADALRKAVKLGRLPAKPDRAMIARATELEQAVEERTAGEHQEGEASDQAIALRNRAFWSLRAQLDEVRAAGRYVYSDDPRTLRHFRATNTRPKKARKPSDQ
jgi:C4-dicarboxylate-specific signal transduction histidine kinase